MCEVHDQVQAYLNILFGGELSGNEWRYHVLCEVNRHREAMLRIFTHADAFSSKDSMLEYGPIAPAPIGPPPTPEQHAEVSTSQNHGGLIEVDHTKEPVA